MTITIYIDHKELTFFFSPNMHESIYSNCVNKLQKLNIKIVYIYRIKNKAMNSLFQTIFPNNNSISRNIMLKILKILKNFKKAD